MRQEYILITASNFPSGGPSATYLNLFCKGLKSHGCEISVYLLKGFDFGSYRYDGPRKNITDDGIPFCYLSSVQRPKKVVLKIKDQLVSLCRLTGLLISLIGRRKSVRVLLYHSDLFFNIPIHFISKLTGIKVYKFVAEIIDKSQFKDSLAGKLSRASYRSNFRYLNKMSDKLIVFSHYLKNEFVRIGFNERNIYIQPNLTDFKYWTPNGGEIKYHLGYSGAPYKKDGLNDLLEAIRILKEEGTIVTLLVVGDVTSGDSLLPGYKSICVNYGINNQVTFTGLVSTPMVKEYMSECIILAVTRPDMIQTKAGFPTKLGEYFALKKPVLTTKFGDMTKYFTDGYDIIMAECNDPYSIAQKLKWMLTNEAELSVIKERGYETAWELLEYNHAMKRIIDFLSLS